MRCGLALGLLLAAVSAPLCAAEPEMARQRELIHLVRQDCGACHGLSLHGGLGPALSAERLRDWSDENLGATIAYGRPGTPMPPFMGILDPNDIRWIARQLRAGFPEGK